MTDHAPQTVADGRDMPPATREYLIRVYGELAEHAASIGNHAERDRCTEHAAALAYGGSLATLFREARDAAGF